MVPPERAISAPKNAWMASGPRFAPDRLPLPGTCQTASPANSSLSAAMSPVLNAAYPRRTKFALSSGALCELICTCEACSQEGMGCDDCGGAGEQAPEGVSAVACQFHLVGDLLEAGLDAVAPLGDDLLECRGHGLALVLRRGDDHGGAAGGVLGGVRSPAEALAGQEPWRRAALGQVGAGLAVVHGGGHDAPGPDDPAARIGLDREAEAAGPLGVRGVAAEPGMQSARPGPAVRAADPGSMPDRQRRGIDLLAVTGRNARGQVGAELPGRAVQPADPPAGLRSPPTRRSPSCWPSTR